MKTRSLRARLIFIILTPLLLIAVLASIWEFYSTSERAGDIFDRGLLYQGHKIVWWWAQGGTALSAGEVGQGVLPSREPLQTEQTAEQRQAQLPAKMNLCRRVFQRL